MAFFSGVVTKVTFAMSAIYRVEAVGMDVLQLVLLGTVLETSVFLFEIPTGVIADVYSRRLSVIIGVAVMGTGFILEGAFPIVATVMLAQVVWGMGWTFISGARSAWITDEVGVEAAGKLFLQFGQVYQVGNLLGIGLAALLARSSLQLPYLIGGGLYVLLAIVLALIMPETGFTTRPKEARETWHDLFETMSGGFQTIRGRASLLWFALISLFVGLYSEGWDRLNEPHLLENHTFPNLFGIPMGAIEWFAVFNIAASLLTIAANQVARKRVETGDTRTLARTLQGLYAVMVVSMAGFALAGPFWLAAGLMLLFDMARSLTHPISQAFVNHYIDSKVRATVLSMTGQIDAIGQMGGGPIIGTVGQIASIPVAILTSAAILFPTVPLFGLLVRKNSSKSSGEPS
jgi:DHA3 family tetracycline resistance protein-like MFS transporter